MSASVPPEADRLPGRETTPRLAKTKGAARAAAGARPADVAAARQVKERR